MSHPGAMGQDQTPSNLPDLPTELLDHIVFFLPLRSIRIPRLMINKKLRSICEKYLYQSISLVRHPYRSLRLLRTLAHRPDLALLIQDLHINLERCHPEVIANSKLPDILQPDALAPLSSARNIRSLHIGGLKWLSEPSLANIRRIVSQMELTSLVITDSYRFRLDNDEEVNQRVPNLRAILQSQPQLEFLCLMRSAYAVNAVDLNAIEVADVPNLRSFKGEAPYVGPFLNTAPKLSKLDLDLGYNGLAYQPPGEGWSGHKVQDLAISVDLSYVSNWSHFESFLARFPNTESLYIWSTDMTNRWDYLKTFPPRLRALPLLRKLAIRNLATEDLDQTVEMLMKCKTHCPTLEQFIDTENRRWVYVPSADEGSGFRAKLDCQLESNSFFYRFDLLPPELDDGFESYAHS